MAKNKRFQGVPIYNVHATEERYDDEDVIDVEVVKDDPGLGQRVREGAGRAYHRVRAQGVRDTFVNTPMDAAKRTLGINTASMGYREDRRARRKERYDAKWAESKAWQEQVKRRQELRDQAITDPDAQLRLGIMEAGEKFSNAIRRSDILAPGQKPETQRKKLEGMHSVYASMMMLQCVEPLRRGLGAQNVLSALGMGAAMWAMSPNFRTQLGDSAASLGKAITDRIEGRANAKGEKAMAKRDKAAEKGSEDSLIYRAKYKMFWKKRIDRMERMERGDRDPFTAESAALAEVALGENAYAAMRVEGADPQQVKDQYEGALGRLYAMVDQDGIPRDDVSRASRTIIGQRMSVDPGYASVFGDLAHGMYDRSSSTQADGSKMWMGDFENPMTGKIVKGSFFARMPMDVNDHRVALRDMIYSEMGSSKTIEELDESLTEMMVAASADTYRSLPEAATDPTMRRRFAKTRTAFDSMAADGLSENQRTFVYTAAYQDAVDVLQRSNPQLGEQWRERFGEHWREHVEAEMDRYREMGRNVGKDPEADSERGRPRGWDEKGRYHDPYEDQDADEDIVDAEIVEDDYEYDGPESTVHDEDIVSAARRAKQSGKPSASTDIALRGAARKNQRAKVNQHYNEIDTGSVTGIGRDDAAPLQDPDFELGD